MAELWQLFDKQGRPLAGKAAGKEAVYKGLLHAAAHVWIWRVRNGEVEVLVQKRAPGKRTWPNRYDISAAGHLDLGEEPIAAAIREAREEIDLEIAPDNLHFIGVHYQYTEETDFTENEFQWLYILRLEDDQALKVDGKEVEALEWKTIPQVENDLHERPDTYVPHSEVYYPTLFRAIRLEAA